MENFCQHAFAVVWWYKAESDQGYFGKPAQVWKTFDYKPCGPALFMSVQRIWQKFACCSMTVREKPNIPARIRSMTDRRTPRIPQCSDVFDYG